MTIARKSSGSESTTGFSTTRRSSAISDYSTISSPTDIEDWFRLCRPDSLVKVSPIQATETPTTKKKTFGLKRWKRLNVSVRPLCILRTLPDYCLQQWTTNQGDLFDTLEKYSATWPENGSMLSGVVWEVQMLDRRKQGGESGFSEGRKLWPTPCAHEARLGWQARDPGQKGCQESLSTAVMKAEGRKIGEPWNGGQLNPEWAGWLMAWPEGQSNLRPLEMGKFQSKWHAPMESLLRSLLEND